MRLGRLLEGTFVACFENNWSVREFVRQEMKVNHTILSALDLRYHHWMEQMQHQEVSTRSAITKKQSIATAHSMP